MILQDAMNRFVRAIETTGRSKATIKTYAWQLSKFVHFLGASRAVDEINHDDVIDFIKFLQKRRAADASLNIAKASLAGFFDYLLEAGHVVRRPFKKLRYDKIVRRPPRVLDKYERTAVSAAALTPENKLLFRLYMDLGLRLSEALSLNVDDFLDTDVVRVIGKRKKVRKLTITEPIREAFQQWVPERDKRLGKVRKKGRVRISPRSLFVTEWGTRMRPRTAQLHIKGILKSIGLADVRVHNLRHTLGKRLADAGTHPRTIQDILGHSDLSSVEIYTPTTRTDIKAALESLPK